MAHRVRQWIVSLACGVLVVFGMVSPATAQAPSGEVAVGYQYMRDSDLGQSFPNGWFVSGAGNVNDWLAVVGEVAGSHASASALVASLDVDVRTYMGGIRYYRRLAGFTPFAQVLIGAARAVATVDLLGFAGEESATSGAVQPGFGVDVQLSDSFGLRFAGDYRRILGNGGTSQVRFLAGVVVGIGSR